MLCVCGNEKKERMGYDDDEEEGGKVWGGLCCLGYW